MTTKTANKAASNFSKAPKAVQETWLKNKIAQGYKDRANTKAVRAYYGKKRAIETWIATTKEASRKAKIAARKRRMLGTD